jgi:hypothetical protein
MGRSAEVCDRAAGHAARLLADDTVQANAPPAGHGAVLRIPDRAYKMLQKATTGTEILMKAIASIAVAIATVVTLAACDVKKTAEGNVTVPKYEVEKKQAGDVTLPKYDVTTPDVKVTKEEKTVTVPTVKTEEKVIEVPKVDVTPAKEK